MSGARQAGQSLVELAVVMPVLLWFALGVVDFGRVFYTYIGLTNAAREGARYATLTAPACNATAIRARVKDEQPSLAIADGMISIDCSQADRRTVNIAYPFEPFTVFIGQALGTTQCNGTTYASERICIGTWATLPT